MTERWLAIAPHPDDETLGCGGTLLALKARGIETGWLIATEMTTAGGFSSEQIAEREQVIERVARTLGVTRHFRAGFAAASLDQQPRAGLVAAISEAVEAFRPTTLLLPFPGDAHSDHRAVFEAANAASKWFRHPSVRRVLAYETLSETGFGLDPTQRPFQPNWYQDIGPQLQAKLDVMQLYASELGRFPFPRSLDAIRAQALLRGAEAGFDAAEAFMLLRERRD